MKNTFLRTLCAFAVLSAALCARFAAAQDWQALYNSDDEATLISALENRGQTPDDVFITNIVCKKLARIGTDAAIPALVNLLPNEALSFNARFALEAMTTDASAEALIKAASELTGAQQVGVVNSIGVRRLAGAVAPLKELLASAETPELKVAVYKALGKIGGADALAVLQEELAKPLAEELSVKKGLADSLFDLVEDCSDQAKILEVYDALYANEAMPLFVRKAAAYHAVLLRGADGIDTLREKLLSDQAACFSVGLKTLREFGPDVQPAVFQMLMDIYGQLPADRQAKILLTGCQLKDDNLKKELLPHLLQLVDSDNAEVKTAAVRALGNVGSVDPAAVVAKLRAAAADDAFVDTIIGTLVALPEGQADQCYEKLPWPEDAASLDDQQAKALINDMKVVELRRISSLCPTLAKIASTPNLREDVLKGALSALSESVTIDHMEDLLSVAGDNPENEDAAWLLKAACTRLPQSASAQRIASRFDAADPSAKVGYMYLLRHIGGPEALAKVEEACYNKDTADKATEILGKWDTPDDLTILGDACLKLAKEGISNKYRIRGIRSYIRIPRQFDIGEDARIAMCNTAFATADRDEDKLLVFDVFKRIITGKSALAALEFAKDPKFKDAACETAVAIAEKYQGTTDQLNEAMDKVIELTDSDDLKARAEEQKKM